MIRRSSKGYTVYARTGRPMGTYRTLARAQVRLGQVEAFAERRAHGRVAHSPKVVRRQGKWVVRAKSGRSMGNYATKGEALRRKGQLEANAARYFTKTRGYTKKSGSPVPPRLSNVYVDDAGRRYIVVGVDRNNGGVSLENLSSGVRTFVPKLRFDHSYFVFGTDRRSHAGSSPRRRTVPNRKDLIAALGLEPEGRTRMQKYAFTTAEFWRKVRTHHSKAARRARRVFGLSEP
jgi:hypothetical protein